MPKGIRESLVYTLPNCVQCNQTKKLMDREGIAYDVVKLEEHPDIAADFKEQGLPGFLPDEIMKLKAHVSGQGPVAALCREFLTTVPRVAPGIPCPLTASTMLAWPRPGTSRSIKSYLKLMNPYATSGAMTGGPLVDVEGVYPHPSRREPRP